MGKSRIGNGLILAGLCGLVQPDWMPVGMVIGFVIGFIFPIF